MSRETAIRRRSARRSSVGRRTLGTLLALAFVVLVAVLIASGVNHAVNKLGLPLAGWMEAEPDLAAALEHGRPPGTRTTPTPTTGPSGPRTG